MKEDGEWRVNFSKGELMNRGAEKAKEMPKLKEDIGKALGGLGGSVDSALNELGGNLDSALQNIGEEIKNALDNQ